MGRAERVILIGLTRQGMSVGQAEASLDELLGLVETARGVVVARLRQEVKKPTPATYIGRGKVLEIKKIAAQKQADLVVVDFDLSPVQNRNLEEIIGVRVADRTAMILDIFSMRARSREGKLQVELAQLKYLAPRLIGRGQMLSQQAGRIGTRGPGETALEYDRRHIKERIARLTRMMEDVRASRRIHRMKRESVPIPLAAIIGYTNSGKSTLTNTLTKAGIFVEDKLFATLDPTVRRLRLPSGREILVADTVGFISRLPHQLVAAFKATFEEISYADLLLEVVDVSDPAADEKTKVVDNVLVELSLNHKPRIVVLNKCDRDVRFYNKAGGVEISALTGKGINTLLNEIDILLRGNLIHVKLYLPHGRGDVLSAIYKIGHVRACRYGNRNIIVDCDLPEKYAKKFGEYASLSRVQE